MKKFLVFAALFILMAMPAAAYTVGQVPPTGTTAGAPYIYLQAGTRYGYIYPTAAQLETLSINPDFTLTVNMSGIAVPTYPGTAPFATRLYTHAFFTAPAGDSQVSILASYLYYNQSPSNGAVAYNTTVRWGFLTGGTNLFNGQNPSLIAGNPIVIDTNIPQFNPGNHQLSRQGPTQVFALVVLILTCTGAMLWIFKFIGGYRKGANYY